LQAGLYRQAKIEEMQLDWRYPWVDPFEIKTYYIVNTTFTGEVWTAQLEGLTHRLKMQVGRVYGRMCDVKTFCDSRCGLTEATYTTTGATVTGINVTRKDIETSLTPPSTNYYKRGYIRWTSGNNTGLTMEVNKSYGTGRLVLWVPMPFDIQVGDVFNAVAGCDRTFAACQSFSNAVNFRGFTTIPGANALLRVPKFHKV
jgi:uncharacterized phage protein (TIGR02218 family)